MLRVLLAAWKSKLEEVCDCGTKGKREKVYVP